MSSIGRRQWIQFAAGAAAAARNDRVEIANGRLRARFTRQAGGVAQEYFAKAAGGAWVLVLKSLHPPSPRPAGTAPLYGDVEVANEHRVLAGSALESVRLRDNHAVLAGRTAGGHRIEQSVWLDEDHFRVEVQAEIAGHPPRIEYLLSSFTFEGGKPEVAHAPCMKRAPEDVIADRVFHSPALFLQKEAIFAALVPDLDLINSQVVYAKGARPLDGTRPFRLPVDENKISMPTALDLELKSGITASPVVSYGFIDFLTQQHMYWRHENAKGAYVRELASNRLRYGFDLFARADAPRHRGYVAVSRYLWRRYGSAYFRKPKPQAMPFDEYAKVCYPAAFAYTGNDLGRMAGTDQKKSTSELLPTWLEFEFNGQPAGGIRCPATQWYDHIQYMGWWNNARQAVGMYWWGKRGHPGLIEKARRMVNLALTAPQREGIFPAVFHYRDRQWRGCYWKPAQPYDPAVLPKYWDFSSDCYQPASASKTGVYLLRYRRLCEDDSRVVPYLRRYGDFLAAHMDPEGSVPGFFTSDLRPVPNLRFNGEGGIHIDFLCELYQATKDARYLAAAERMAAFLRERILPEQRWYDFETFYSCASKPEGTYDARTGQWPRCTLSMIWAIDGFTALFEATRNREHLAAAEAVADYASFYQAVWQPHFIITAYAFGGYTSQNTDAEWLDMRQPLFAEAVVRLGQHTRRQDLYERGVAALRASFALIHHPRLIENRIFATPNYPLGLGPENIDHEGIPQLPLRSGFDWGEGGGLAAAATIMQQTGGAHVDFANRIACGVDGVYVKAYRRNAKRIQIELLNQLGALPVPYEPAYSVELNVSGLPPGRYELEVNGGAPVAATAEELKRLPIRLPPGGKA